MLLLVSSLGVMDVYADFFDFVKISTISHLCYPIALLGFNKLPILGKMSLNQSEMKNPLLASGNISLAVILLNTFLLRKAAECEDRNKNNFLSAAFGIEFFGRIVQGLCFGDVFDRRNKKTEEYRNAANRFIDLAKKECSPEEKLEMSQLIKKLIVTKETPREDIYSFKGYDGERYQLIQGSEGNFDLKKVTAS
jgi:hypothetical protein